MKTNRILIAILFPITLAACATDHSQFGVTPISTWAELVAHLHTPQWKEPSDSCQKIADHWDSIVKHDMMIAWHYATRPDQIEDSTVVQLTGEYVASDSLPNVFERHIARLDTAENVAENYMIDQRRLYATNPEAIHNIPIAEHAAGWHRAEIEALRTALSLRQQVRAIAAAEHNYFGNGFGAR
ncbi:MAG TPA: hypothetical protein VFD13_08880 [Candidatus Kapabacteria bacterium]|nr:hypothetical protein [Candidatus Kapabacteria bacterium]